MLTACARPQPDYEIMSDVEIKISERLERRGLLRAIPCRHPYLSLDGLVCRTTPAGVEVLRLDAVAKNYTARPR